MSQLDLRIIKRPREWTPGYPFLFFAPPQYFVTYNGVEIEVLQNHCIYWRDEDENGSHPEKIIDDILRFIWRREDIKWFRDQLSKDLANDIQKHVKDMPIPNLSPIKFVVHDKIDESSPLKLFECIDPQFGSSK